MGRIDGERSERQRAVMPSLSVGLDRLRDHYDAVVVGSGYGGAITAARLAQAGRRVCVLERGRELRPGDFPRSLRRGLREIQWRTGARRRGRRGGLFDLRPGRDITVLVGCGLGGTSLINAGVALRAPGWVFEDERWPEALRRSGDTNGDGDDNDDEHVLAPYYARAEQMLDVGVYPEAWPNLPKVEALHTAMADVDAAVRPAPVAVSFRRSLNRSGIDWPAAARTPCQLCGDCVSGCNYGAKNTVAMNYLPLAVAHGAEIFTEVEVRTVLPAPSGRGGWIVSFDAAGKGRSRFRAPSLFVHADVVVLAAGTLGSTEILFNSRAAGLATSPRLGHAFSGNGDALAFAYGADRDVRGVGLGEASPTPETAVGPCIAGMAAVTSGLPVRGGHTSSPGGAGPTSSPPVTSTDGWLGPDDLLVQEGVVPGALRPLFSGAIAFAAELDGGGGPWRFARRLGRRLVRGLGSVRDASRRTLTYLLMGDDRGDGRLVPNGDGVEVRWTDAGEQPIFDRGEELLRKASASIGAELVPNPLASPMFRDAPVTVHPLGGCAMADDGSRGVVDDRGRVFTGEGREVHDGLYVMDGAVVPRPLVVNPLLTISALAERSAELLVEERRWGRTGSAPEARTLAAAFGATRDDGKGEVVPGLELTERMRGFVALASEADSVEDCARRGRADGTGIELVLTVTVDDLPALLDDPSRPGGLSGTVVAPILSLRRLRVTDGRFVLVQEDRTQVDTWLMRYSMLLEAEDGRRFRLEGTKTLHDRPGLDAWSDTTTLAVVITEQVQQSPSGGEDLGDEPRGGRTRQQGSPLVAKGVLTLSPTDFARQLTTMRVTGVRSRLERVRWLARFDARFLRSLLKVYGGPLDDVAEFPPAHRQPMPLTGPGNRKLRLPSPEPRWCDGRGRWHEGNDLGDDAWLRLIRYEGGRRGPVLLAPGFSMSATSFLVDTTKQNLVEHLVAKGYDVWLFDYRAGIDLPSASTSFTMDDIALHDWPTAVTEVLRVAGASSVQAVGHCFGSATLMMALAAGLRDVRSAVSMQVTLDFVTSTVNQMKCTLRLPEVLQGIGLRNVAPLRGVTLPNTVLDLALRAVPLNHDERCGRAICRWVNAIYGSTHRHAQLNDATHDMLPELFDVGDLTAIDHGRQMMQNRALIHHSGRDLYRAHPERLRLPLLLLHGEQNRFSYPEGSLRTLRRLQAANDPSLCERVVIPGYAHLDCLIGRDAHRDVYPVISGHLNRFNR